MRCLAWFVFPVLAAGATDSLPLPDRTLEKSVPLRTHSLYAPYIDQDLQNRWWSFGADAYVNTNKHVRLTRPVASQMGWLWSRLPLTAANYQIDVEFKIGGESSHLYGDGLAMWLTKERAQPGPVFGYIDKFEGLGIFFDTYANGKHPYGFPRVMAMLGDGRTAYVQSEDGDPNAIGACTANIRRATVGTKLRLTYIKDGVLDLQLQYKAWDEFTPCFKIFNVTLPTGPYLGFSALTGDVFDSHDIISVTTLGLFLSNPQTPKHTMKGKGPAEPRRTSWFGRFIKLLLVVGACVGAVVGFRMYNEKGSHWSTKRF